MSKKQKKIVCDAYGEKVGVLISVTEFDKLIDELEDIDDVEYIEKYHKKKPTKFYPLEEVMSKFMSRK